MKIYESIYSFEILGRIRKGGTVCVVDRRERTIENANSMSVGDLARVLNVSDEETTRFEFFIEKEIEEKAEENKE